MKAYKLSLFYIAIFFVLTLTSCHVSKGFEALEVYNYFAAKEKFEKGLKRHTSPSAYGLSIIYSRNDNPFHNLDSAYHYSLLSVETYKSIKENKKDKLKEKFDFNYEKTVNNRAKISELIYRGVREKNTITAYVDFKARHPWSIYKDSAIYYRDELAFEAAKQKGTSSAFMRFLRFYDESRFVTEATALLEEAQYKETTAENTLEAFERFIEIFPENRYVNRAHDQIFKKMVQENTISEFEAFLRRFPKNPNADMAWLSLYRLSIADYTKTSIDEFIEKYPEFPFYNLAYTDLELVEKALYPYRLNGHFGYMNEKGLPLIPAQYKSASLFSNGLAAVYKDGKYGFIDKNNEVIIDFIFDDAQDFEKGRAIVEFEGYYGLIDRAGNFVLDPIYEDIGNISNGMVYAYKNDKYAYFNKNGHQVFDTWYDEAFTFYNGLAKVIQGDTVGFIRTDGSYLIYKTHADLKPFSKGLFIYDHRDSMNIIDLNDSLKLPFYVDRIGNLYENRAIIEKDGKYGYIDSVANLVIEPELDTYSNYFQFAQFKNGHAKVFRKNKFALIDSIGESVLPAIFTNIGTYGELIPITKGDKWGYADENVKLKIKYIYDYAYPFEGGVAIVQKDRLYGLIDLDGEEVISIEYENIQRLGTEFLLLKNEQNRFALYDIKGNQLSEMIYVRFHQLENKFIQLESENSLDYFNTLNHKIITLLKENE